MSFPTPGVSEKLKGGQVVHKSTTHLNFARWTSDLSRLPFTEKIMGSNPIRVTKIGVINRS